MIAGKGKPEDEVRAHDEFLELCALSTSESLSEEEQKRLSEHLTVCRACREAMEQFVAVVDRAIPSLAPELASEVTGEDPSFSQRRAEAAFRRRLSDEKGKVRIVQSDAEPWLSPVAVRRGRDFRRSLGRIHFWFPLFAGMVLCLALGILAYRMGKHHGIEVAQLKQGIGLSGPVTLQQAQEVVGHDRDAAEAQLAERDKSISELRREIARQSAENGKLKALQSEQQRSLQANEEEKKEMAEARDRLTQQVAAGQAALEASERKLDGLERARAEDAIQSSKLEKEIGELSRSLQEQQSTTVEQQDLLAKDRDIRELMGARDLYVAEVYDVARTGETQKAFGRVFYTKGKSLIFYAYDLNDQPGLTNASTFQAWGRRGPDRNQAFNLGMFFEDNVSKKRWVLKFNDKKTLDQIDAVFVTVEPYGGSERPTGKPLLFAYLKVAANHP
jgi:Anti-sigma-K factor rskA